MKKNYSIICLVQVIIASALLFPVTASSQDLTDAQKQERCQNNKNRIAELETELRIISADLSQTMEKKEIQDAKDNIDFLMIRKDDIGNYNPNGYADWKKVLRIASQYNFNFSDCEKRNAQQAKFDIYYLIF